MIYIGTVVLPVYLFYTVLPVPRPDNKTSTGQLDGGRCDGYEDGTVYRDEKLIGQTEMLGGQNCPSKLN